MIAVTKEPLDPGAMIEAAKKPETGGLVTFTGIVRDDNIMGLDLEICEEIALKDLNRIAKEAENQFSLTSVDIIHRYGRLELSDTILVIIAGASHRKEAFEGCSWILEQIKEFVPIWKKDILSDGEKWHFPESEQKEQGHAAYSNQK